MRSSDDGAKRQIDPQENFGMIPANGTSVQMTELAPGAVTPNVGFPFDLLSSFFPKSHSIGRLLWTTTFSVSEFASISFFSERPCVLKWLASYFLSWKMEVRRC